MLSSTTDYRDLTEISPSLKSKGLFEGTPIVNNSFLEHVRAGLVDYKRGDSLEITLQGVRFNERDRDSKPGEEGVESVERADV